MKKRKIMARCIALALGLLFAVAFISGCVSVNFSSAGGGGVSGRGTPEIFTYKVGEITEVRVQIACNIEYYSAPSDTVTLEIQPNLHEYISVTEVGGVLTISSTSTISRSGNNVPVLTISTPSLKHLSLSGAGIFTGHDKITGDYFGLNVYGAASGTANLDVDALLVNISGAGDFRLSGSADRAQFVLAGAGNLDALFLETREASVSFSGAGTIKLHCSDSLSITASGVGTVEYRGSPNVDINRSGIVTVRKID